jgi:hypothetical protein
MQVIYSLSLDNRVSKTLIDQYPGEFDKGFAKRNYTECLGREKTRQNCEGYEADSFAAPVL